MDLLIRYAYSFLGKPYIWGGDDPIIGFDCSGFVLELLASAGVGPLEDTTAQGIYNFHDKSGTHGVEQAGALAFYGESVIKITHIAPMIDRYRIIEFGGGGSSTTSAAAAAEQNAYCRVRPLRRRKDLVATIMPRYAPIGIV